MYEIEFTDMERAPMGKVFERLRCGTNGLSTKEAEERLELFGPNKFKKTDQESDVVKFFRFMWNPISWAMEFTAIMSLVLANGGGKPTDWEDFVGIIVLLLINTTTSFIVEKEACSASDALMAHLAPKTKVLRDGKWVKDDASNLVPGDIIRIMAGDKIPADCRLLEGEPLEIDESALTGESFPATERSGDIVYCGSICKQGETEAVVIATGVHTLYCNAAPVLVDSRNQEDRCLQKALTTVGNLCLCFIFAGLYLEILSIGPVPKRGYRAVIDNLLVLLIGGIPIAMPTVFSGLMATASLRLSEQGVIIKRVSAIEEIGSMDVLFVDKTRTLTMNKLSVEVFAKTVEPEDVPEGTKESPGDPWQLIGLKPLLDSVSNESAETIRRAHDLGVNVKMITGDQLAIAKETGRRIGLGTNMYPATPLLTGYKYSDLIEVADGYSSVSPEQRYEIVKHLQDKRHICGITGDTIDDVPALERANISIAVADATDAARRASDILLTKPGLSEIISVILTSRAISQKMKNCAVYAISITVRIVLCFFLITVIWDFDFPPFMALVIAVLNYGTMKTIIMDRVKPSPKPDRWKMAEIFTTGIVLGVYLAMMTVVFFWTAYETEFFPRTFKVTSLHKNDVKDFKMLASAVFLQVSTISQALIFVTRTRAELAGVYLVSVSVATHMEMTTVIAVYADWGFASIEGIGWRWAGVILLYNLICYIPLVPLKLFVRYVLNERKDNFEREELQRRWAHSLRNLHGRDNDGIQQREDEDDEQAHFLPHL